MPWSAAEAHQHNHRATTPAARKLWAKVANEELAKHGNEGRAIRAANAAVDRMHARGPATRHFSGD